MKNYDCVYENADGFMIYNYFFMENVMSSPEPALKYIEHNNKVFEKGCRSEKDLQELAEIHEGIEVAFAEELKFGKLSMEYDFVDVIASIVQDKFSQKEISYFDNSILVDEFCNRNFDLKLNK